MHNAPKIADADGKGWTQRDGKKLRGFRDGVTFKIERIGDTEYYENNEGSTGTRTYDDKRHDCRAQHVRHGGCGGPGEQDERRRGVRQ